MGSTTTIWRPGRGLAALACVLALVGAAACGGDDDAEGGGSPSTGPAPTGEPITIGNMVFANPGVGLEMRTAGVQAAVDAINGAGGIDGRPLELVTCAAEDASAGEQCARDMVDAGVVATIADGNIIAEAASTEILNQAGIAQVDPFISTADALASPNVFLLAPGSPVTFAATVRAMDLVGLKSYHYIAGAFSTAQNSIDATTTAAEKYGIDIVGEPTEIPLTAADYTPFVGAASDVDADAQLTIIAPNMTSLLLQAADQMGEEMPLALNEGQFNQEQIDQYGSTVLDGTVMAYVTPPLTAGDEFPVVDEFLEQIDAYHESSGNELASPEQVTSIAFNAWLDVQAFEEVAKDLDEVSAATVMDAFNTVEDIDLGLTHPWTPSAEGAGPYARSSNPWLYLSTIKDGEVELIQPEPVDALEPWRE